jgi:hypothetical protein
MNGSIHPMAGIFGRKVGFDEGRGLFEMNYFLLTKLKSSKPTMFE